MHAPDRRPRLSFHLAALAVVTVALAAGAPARVDAAAPTSAPAAWKYIHNLPSDQQLKVIEREAKREGRFLIYGALGIDRANILLKFFHKEYPDIKSGFVRMRTAEVVQKALLEQRTNQVRSDLLISSVADLELLSPALAPYEPPTWKNFDPRFREGSYEKGWTAMSYELLPSTICWRTDRVSKSEEPKTLADVANPRWDGRTGTHISIEKFIQAMISKYGEKEGMARVKALAAIHPRLYQSTAALAQGLAAGEIDLAWEFQAHRAVFLQKKGVPVKYILQKPLFGLGVTISAVKGAPHPYAAALFMDFLTRADVLSKLDKVEGGRIFGNTKGHYTTRLSDVPNLRLYRPISPARYRELSRIAERLFIRK